MVRLEGFIALTLHLLPALTWRRLKQDMVNVAKNVPFPIHWGGPLHPREKTDLTLGKRISIHLGEKKTRSYGRESIISNQ